MNMRTTPRNQMTGFAMRGGIERESPFTPLEVIENKVNQAHDLQRPSHLDRIRVIGASMEADALHELIEFVNSDPEHRKTV